MPESRGLNYLIGSRAVSEFWTVVLRVSHSVTPSYPVLKIYCPCTDYYFNARAFSLANYVYALAFRRFISGNT